MHLPPLNADLALDPKGRVMLPRTLRDALDDEGINKMVAFANGGPRRGLAFSRVGDYRALAARHQGGPAAGSDVIDLMDARARLFALAVASTAQAVSIDNAGRMLIPSPLRAMLGLDHDLYLFTAGGWFEIWDRARWLAEGFPQAAQAWDDLYGFDSLRPGARLAGGGE